MIWLLLYVYIMGTVNDFMIAVLHDADLDDWKIHASIALWPITVPMAIVAVAWENWNAKE